MCGGSTWDYERWPLLRPPGRRLSDSCFDDPGRGHSFHRVEPLPTQTLLGLLRMYDTAIADLRAMHDPTVAKLIDRLTLHRDEVVVELATK